MENKTRVDFLPSLTKRICNNDQVDLRGHFIKMVEPAGQIFRVAMCVLTDVPGWKMLADVHPSPEVAKKDCLIPHVHLSSTQFESGKD